MKQLQFHCEVSRKDRSWAIEDKAGRGLANPPPQKNLPARALRNAQLNQTHHTTKHSPVWPGRGGGEGVKATVEGARRTWMGRKFPLFMLSSQTVGTTWNTICVFLLLPKLRKQQREQIPLQKKLPLLDIYAS